MKRLYILLIVVLAFYSKMQAQCFPNDADNNDVTKAIALVSYNGQKFTGTVVNSDGEGGEYYFMTSMIPFHDDCGTGVSNYISSITFKWRNGQTTTGATLLSSDNDNEFVAILELDDAPPFEVISYLGVDDDGANRDFCISHSDDLGSVYMAEHVVFNSINYGNYVNLICNGENDFEFGTNFITSSKEAIVVYQWIGISGNINNQYSLGAPLISTHNEVIGIYAMKTGGVYTDTSDVVICNEDTAYFVSDFEYVAQEYLGTSSIRAIKIDPCVEEIVKNATIDDDLIEEATIRIIGKSKINNVQVRFQAGQEVILEDGFESGNDFIAEIKPCVAKITPIAKRENEGHYTEEVKNNIYRSTDIENVTAYPTVEIDDYVIIESSGLNIISYSIIALDGKTIVYGEYNASNSTFQQRIDLPNISAGIYFLNIQSTSQLKTIKIVKQ